MRGRSLVAALVIAALAWPCDLHATRTRTRRHRGGARERNREPERERKKPTARQGRRNAAPARPAGEDPPTSPGAPASPGAIGASGAIDVPTAVPPMLPVEVVHTVVTRGLMLENLTWVEAEPLLTPDTVVVIPLGAAAKEHGPHLKLKNDWLIAEYLKRRVLESADVIVAPTVPYHFYPAFIEYPGSTSLRLETARDLLVDVCRSLARFGPRRFYVLNTGISTLRALAPAAEQLAAEGLLMRWSDTRALMGEAERAVRQQEGGSHADEIETSMMLYIAPDSVDMRLAKKDYDATGEGRLSRTRGAGVTYSPTGIWGDATLGTREKGARVVEALVAGVLADIEALRRDAPPQPQPPQPQPAR